MVLFPLLKLPVFGIEAVILNLGFCDLINFSFVSKRCKRILRSIHIPSKQFLIQVTNKCVSIQLIYKPWEEYAGEWVFNHVDYEERETPYSFSVNGCEFRNFLENDKIYSYGNYHQFINVAFNYLRPLFKCYLYDIEFKVNNIPKSRLPLLIDNRGCYVLLIEGTKRLEYEEEMKAILEHYKPINIVCFLLHVRDDFSADIRQWGNPKKIQVSANCSWLTGEMLLSSKSSTLTFYNCQLTAKDCRLFVQRWYYWRNKTDFTYLKLTWKNRVPEDLTYESIALPMAPFNEEKRHRDFFPLTTYAVDCSTGQDIERRGRLATVLIQPDSFIFCVWHERFPNVNGVKVIA